MKKIVSLLVVFVLVIEVQAQLPRVIILATGGTIAGAGASADRAGYTAGKIPIEDLIGAIPSVKKIATITGEQVASVGSQDMTIDIWKKLAVRINQIFANNEADAINYTWYRYTGGNRLLSGPGSNLRQAGCAYRLNASCNSNQRRRPQ